MTGIDPKLASRYQESLERIEGPDLIADQLTAQTTRYHSATVKSVDNAINDGLTIEKLRKSAQVKKDTKEAAMGFEMQ